MNWIDIKDKLPPKSDHKKTCSVLLLVPRQQTIMVVGYADIDNEVNIPYTIKQWKHSYDDDHIYDEVTHWMELPELPATFRSC